MWWIWLFWITIAFSLAYLWFYPGLGTWQGTAKWSSAGQYREEVQLAEQQYGPLYARLAAVDLAELSKSTEAQVVGQKLFINYCSQCHSSDGRGAKGFPNLTDGDWLYGGDPQAIKASILDGRKGTMPPMAAAVGDEKGAREMAHLVRSFSGLPHDPAAAARSQPKFAVCAACHGADAKGNPALGAPNLTDKVWLYGGSEATIIESIAKGRNGVMPAMAQTLGTTSNTDAKLHLLAAYVYGLSQKQ